MKESKDEAILPCYRDGYGVWHYSDDTHEKVYGLNEQMCDIGKTMSDVKLVMDDIVRRAEENIRLYNDNNKYARFVRAAYESKFGKPKEKDIMEEKKTKKMTKAEAFEWLKCKKVHCNNNYRRCYALQEKLFEIGFEWTGGGNTTSNVNCLFIGEDARLSHCVSLEWFRRHVFEELSVDDILSIEIVEEKKEKFVDCSEPCEEIKAVQELLRNSKHLKGKTLVITKDNAAIL